MKNIFKFFWNKDYPLKTHLRLYFLIALSVYMIGRIIDPGPEWLRNGMDIVIHDFNLEIIQSIKLSAPKSATFWTGTGLALQLQLLLTWPIACFFAIKVAWINRKGSKDFDDSLQDMNQIESIGLIRHIFLSLVFLMIFYFPFYGSDISKAHSSKGGFSRIMYDTYGSCIFWAFAGCAMIVFACYYFFQIYNQYQLKNKRGE